MYKQNTTIKLMLGSENGKYKKPAYKAVASTNTSLKLKPEDACIYISQLGKSTIDAMLHKYNTSYEIRIVQLRFNYKKVYKCRDINVRECKAIVTFDILWNGNILSDSIARSIIEKLIRDLDGYPIINI